MALTFHIEGRHLEVTPALEEHVINKLSKIDKIFGSRTNTIHVILSVSKIEQKAEAELKIPGDKNPIFAEAVTDDMYQSIDKLADKMYHQVLKYHGKLTGHPHHKDQKDKE